MFRMSLIFICALCLVHCTKKDSGSKRSSAEESTTALALANASPSQSLKLVSSALNSFDEAIKTASGSLAIELVGENKENLSKWCSGNAEPLANADSKFTSLYLEDNMTLENGQLSAMSDKYAARLFHCKMKVDTGSPESIQGIIALPRGLICALENAELLDFTNPGESKGTFELSKSCFSESFIRNVTEEMGTTTGTANVKLSVLDGADGTWDKQVTLTDISLNPTAVIEIKLSNTVERMGVLITETDDSNPGSQTASSFTLSTNGALRVETKTYRLGSNDEDNRFNRSMRLLATGTMEIETTEDEMSAKYTDFESYQGIYADIGGRSPYVSGLNGQLATISGTVEGGFLTRSYVCNKENSHDNADQCNPEDNGISVFFKPNSGAPVCVPSEKKCADIQDIEFKDTSFLMLKSNVKDLKDGPITWAADLVKPLDFSSVTSDFAQLPE